MKTAPKTKRRPIRCAEAVRRSALEKSLKRSITFHAWLVKRIEIMERKLAAETKKMQKLVAVFDPSELGAQRRIDYYRERCGELDRVIAELQGRLLAAKNVVHSEFRQLNPVLRIDPDGIQFSRALAPRAPV